MAGSSFLSRRALLLAAPALLIGTAAMWPHPRAHVSRETVLVNGRTVHFERAGSGPALVLIHGASGSHRDWTFRHLPALAERFDVIAFDRPGLGASDPAPDPYSLASQADVMVAALGQIGPKTAAIVGHSYGGAVALAWALNHPDTVDALVTLSAPSHPWPGSPGRLYDITNTPVIGWGFSRLVPFLATDTRLGGAMTSIFRPQPIPDGFATHVNPRLSVEPRQYKRNAGQIGALKGELRDMAPRYPSLGMPIAVVHGLEDTIVRAMTHVPPFEASVPNANVRLMEGVGHMPHHAEPDLLPTTLDRLLG